MKTIAYTMGNKSSYDKALKEPKPVEKLGRTNEYGGGCCWPTYEEADEWINKNRKNIPYTPHIYSIILLNGWNEDTSDDTYKSEEFYSLLNNSIIKHCEDTNEARKTKM